MFTGSAISLSEVLCSDCISLEKSYSSKDEVLRDIAHISLACSKLDHISESEIYNAFVNMEKEGSSGFDHGIAIPHCRLDSVQEFVVGMITVPDGVEFESLDGNLARLIFFIIAPNKYDDNHTHLMLLSKIAQVVHLPEVFNELMGCSDIQKAKDTFLKHVPQSGPNSHIPAANLIYIFVQDETLFHTVLQIFSTLGANSMVVLNAEEPRSHFADLPLFVGFWSDHPHRFCKVIVATLNRKLTHVAIRHIEEHTGPLDDCKNLLISVQRLSYMAGGLSFD